MQSFLTHLQRNRHKNEKGKKKEKTSLHNTKSHTPSFSFESVSASKTLFSKGPTTPYLLPFYTRVPSMFFNTPQHKKINCLPMFCWSHVEYQFRPNCGRRAAIQSFFFFYIFPTKVHGGKKKRWEMFRFSHSGRRVCTLFLEIIFRLYDSIRDLTLSEPTF